MVLRIAAASRAQGSQAISSLAWRRVSKLCPYNRSTFNEPSCFQDIAGEGAFSLAMIAEYQDALFAQGAWFYRWLFWESGLIGQVLYLEAEAAGLRATGIGCYFDDPVHRVFGIEDLAFQSLYHFTVGGPVDDPRLTTLAPYGTLADAQERGIDRP